MMQEKNCKRCGVQRHLHEFPKRHDRPSLRPWCKSCYSQYSVEHHRKYPRKTIGHDKLQRIHRTIDDAKRKWREGLSPVADLETLARLLG